MRDIVAIEKQAFARSRRIGFIDIIKSIDREKFLSRCPHGIRFGDALMKDIVTEWEDVRAEIDRLPNLKRIGFSRKTFNDVKFLLSKVASIREYACKKQVHFECLLTPARGCSPKKIRMWTAFLSKTKTREDLSR